MQARPVAAPRVSARLGTICGVTHTAPDLGPVEHAYTTYLGMRVQGRGVVDPATAAGWGAPLAAGCRTLTLLPEIGDETFLRFIEDPKAGAAAPFITHGWNATEFTVQDTDALAARLAGSPFTIIGQPCNLTGFEWIRAMQVLGPAGECLYLTDVGGDPSLAPPRAMVGQVFIAVAGGADIGAMRAFYRNRFGNPVSDPVAVPIGVLSAANRLPLDQSHALALVETPHGTRIELDQYPACTTAREVMPGHLPPGMAMVSFHIDRPPGNGQEAACLRGAAGELIELCSGPG